jgi:hypothetical protein
MIWKMKAAKMRLGRREPLSGGCKALVEPALAHGFGANWLYSTQEVEVFTLFVDPATSKVYGGTTDGVMGAVVVYR